MSDGTQRLRAPAIVVTMAGSEEEAVDLGKLDKKSSSKGTPATAQASPVNLTSIGIIERVVVDDVTIPDTHRKADPEVVKRLAESIKRFGLLNPISLHRRSDREVVLVSGRHRLEAARLLGEDFIDAVFVAGNAIDLRLREITENLHRKDLTVQERSDQIAEWAALIEQKDKLAQVGPVSNKGGRGKEGGNRKAARDLKLTRQDIQRSKKIASITPEAKTAAAEAGLTDNQAVLLEVAAEPADQQAAKVAEIVEKKKAKEAKPKAKLDCLIRAWVGAKNSTTFVCSQKQRSNSEPDRENRTRRIAEALPAPTPPAPAPAAPPPADPDGHRDEVQPQEPATPPPAEPPAPNFRTMEAVLAAADDGLTLPIFLRVENRNKPFGRRA